MISGLEMSAAQSKIRISYGTALKLGLISGRTDAKPTTAYLLTPFPCYMECKFCDQNQEKRMLSRIPWPEYPLEEVIPRLKNSAFKRLCIQTVYNLWDAVVISKTSNSKVFK